MLVEVEPTFGEFTFPAVKAVRGCMLYRYAVQNNWDFNVVSDLLYIADNLFCGAGIKEPSREGIVVLGLDGKLYCDTLISKRSLITQVSGSVESAIRVAKSAIGNYMSLSEQRNKLLYNVSDNMPAYLDTLNQVKVIKSVDDISTQPAVDEQEIKQRWLSFMTLCNLNSDVRVIVSQEHSPERIKVLTFFSIPITVPDNISDNDTKAMAPYMKQMRESLNFYPSHIKTHLDNNDPIEVIVEDKYRFYRPPDKQTVRETYYMGAITVRTPDPSSQKIFALVRDILLTKR